MMIHGELPSGVLVRDLAVHEDARGTLTELFRADWGGLAVPKQWNYVRSKPNSLRGVHIHRDHEDFLIVLEGVMRVGLYDCRNSAPSHRRSALVDLSGDRLRAIVVPVGVMHGFYFAAATRYVYGLTACWTPADDLGCRWDDPALGLPWGAVNPTLSDRDRDAPSLAELEERIAALGWSL